MTDTALAPPVHQQLELEVQPLVQPNTQPTESIQERFEAFHAANPWVLTALEKLTREHLETGARRLGIGMLWEVIRWKYASATRGDDFRANNNFRSRYVRLLRARNPEWSDVFAVRELRSP